MMIWLLLACVPDDVPEESGLKGDDSSVETDDSNPPAEQSIVGDWRSEGENVADLLVAAGLTWVEAHFETNSTYSIQFEMTDGKTYDLAGNYTVDTSTLPGSIVVNQTSPAAVTAEGIWQVDGNILSYEVAQTSGSSSFIPPTPEGGFGSTSGPNVEPGVNIQLYVRM
jgi:hypothetical protein